MDVAKFKAMCDAGLVQDGAVLLFAGDSWLAQAIKWFSGRFNHAAQIWRAESGQWVLGESTFEGNLLRPRVNGPQIIPMFPRLQVSNQRVWLVEWTVAPRPEQVATIQAEWAAMDPMPYGVHEIAAWIPILAAVRFYTVGLGRFLPWKNWRLKRLNEQAPWAIGNGIVCSQAVARACVAAGLVVGINAMATTPDDIADWPGTMATVEL